MNPIAGPSDAAANVGDTTNRISLSRKTAISFSRFYTDNLPMESEDHLDFVLSEPEYDPEATDHSSTDDSTDMEDGKQFL